MKQIKIGGVIVSDEDKWIYDLLGIEAVSPHEINEAFEKTEENEPVTLLISSQGGDVIAANEIYYTIQSHRGDVTADITGLAASAASYIALAASKVRMIPTAMFMIHNVSGEAAGDYRAMDQESKVLKNFNKAIAAAYRIKTGMGENALLSLMDRTTWMTAQDAKEYGFIDEIIGDEDGRLSQVPMAVYNAFGGFIPKEKIEALRMKLKNMEEDKREDKREEKQDGTQAKILKDLLF